MLEMRSTRTDKYVLLGFTTSGLSLANSGASLKRSLAVTRRRDRGRRKKALYVILPTNKESKYSKSECSMGIQRIVCEINSEFRIARARALSKATLKVVKTSKNSHAKELEGGFNTLSKCLSAKLRWPANSPCLDQVLILNVALLSEPL